MPEPDLFLVFVEPLNRAGIPYMVTGSVAGVVYGEPRLTHDVDLVVELDAHRIEDFIAVAETVSGQDLEAFFDGWLYDTQVPGIPEMELTARQSAE